MPQGLVLATFLLSAPLGAVEVVGELKLEADTTIDVAAGTVTTNLIDSVEITADTNIVVAANEVLKIEYVHGENPVTVTKSGEGRLEIATSSITNLSVVVAEGAFASARPAAIPLDDTFRPSLRLDASDATKFTYSQSNGTNFLTKVMDADGGENYGSAWGGYGKPYVPSETLNGLGLIDFGTFKNNTHLTSGHCGMLGLHAGVPLGDYFYVWKDRDDSIDAPLNNGAAFNGPAVIGNNGSWYSRGQGGGGQGFGFYSPGMAGSIKKNIHFDGMAIPESQASTYRVPRGFHVFRNRIPADKSVKVETVGWSSPYGGGFVLAELVVYSNRLSEATAMRVEAQLQSKWLGMKLKAVTVRENALLDVSAVKFCIGEFNAEGNAVLAGTANFACNISLVSPTTVVSVADSVYTAPDQSAYAALSSRFAGDAAFMVTSGSNIVESVLSGEGRIVKSGAGALCVVNPDSEIRSLKVESGTLMVDSLSVRMSEYHVDATVASSIDTAETDGKALVSEWRDLNNPARTLKPTTWRKPNFDTSRLVRAPYLVQNAAGSLPMVDFGTFADANHTEGWGAGLAASKTFGENNGLHDIFAVWKDDPAVKNYAYGVEGTKFSGPCLFGAQYYWCRGLGGSGESFAMHYPSAPGRMTGNLRIDGTARNAQTYRVGDGVHVLCQRISAAGAPFEEMGENYQTMVVTPSGNVNGVFGGLAIGEVLLFKDAIPDLQRQRIEGALCAKWIDASNIWSYDLIEVAAGARLEHPNADLVLEELMLGGKLSAKSVKPQRFTIAADGAEIDGTLELAAGGELVVASNGSGEFNTLSASSVFMSGRGTLSFATVPPPQFIGREIKLIASDNITASVYKWSVPSLLPNGMKANLVVRGDGLYLVLKGGGFSVVIR